MSNTTHIGKRSSLSAKEAREALPLQPLTSFCYKERAPEPWRSPRPSGRRPMPSKKTSSEPPGRRLEGNGSWILSDRRAQRPSVDHRQHHARHCNPHEKDTGRSAKKESLTATANPSCSEITASRIMAVGDSRSRRGFCMIPVRRCRQSVLDPNLCPHRQSLPSAPLGS